MTYRVFDIKYDIDGIFKMAERLPRDYIFKIDCDDGTDPVEKLRKAVDDTTGWKINSFNYEELKDDIDFEGIANYLIDYLCELYSPKETIALLSRAGCDEDQLVELGFDAADVKQVLKEEEEEENETV